jgi:hypothetical protein
MLANCALAGQVPRAAIPLVERMASGGPDSEQD